MNTDVYNHFERFEFDFEGDEGTQPNFSYGEHVEIPTAVINSPPPKVQRAEEIPDHHGCKEARQDDQRQGPVKRKPRKQDDTAMDYDEQIVIPGKKYKSWLQNASEISRRGTQKKVSRDIISATKIRSLMELPPINSIEGEVKTIPSSESGHVIPPLRAEAKSGRNFSHGEHVEIPTAVINSPPPKEVQRADRRQNPLVAVALKHILDATTNRSNEPVAEQPTWQFTEPNFKISRLSENGPTPDHGKFLKQ